MRHLTWLDRFCIFLVGFSWFVGVAIGLAVVFAAAIMLGNT
jgi:hypothetical protein